MQNQMINAQVAQREQSIYEAAKKETFLLMHQDVQLTNPLQVHTTFWEYVGRCFPEQEDKLFVMVLNNHYQLIDIAPVGAGDQAPTDSVIRNIFRTVLAHNDCQFILAKKHLFDLRNERDELDVYNDFQHRLCLEMDIPLVDIVTMQKGEVNIDYQSVREENYGADLENYELEKESPPFYRNIDDLISHQNTEVDRGSLWTRKKDTMVLVDEDEYITTIWIPGTFEEVKN